MTELKSIIEVKQVHKVMKNKVIINDISFSIGEGEIVGLLGPNGSGKTTMIRLLNGVIDATSGELSVLGKSVQQNGHFIRSQSGIVTETTSLYHEMSAWDNLVFFASVYGVTETHRIEELLKDFGMWTHKDELVGSFSTGMKKRVALCKALLAKPKILFLDEPTNGLDPEGIAFVFSYLKQLREKEGVTIIICTHVLSQLDGFCDSYLFLKNGEVIERGTKKEIEEKHLKEYKVKVRCGLTTESAPTSMFPYIRIGKDEYVFTLTSKEEISSLLTNLLHITWVEEVNILNNGLEHLYFLVGGEKLE